MQTAPECSTTCAPAPTSLSLRADFHAKTFHAREKARGYAEREADFGRSTRVSFARFDPVSFSWKIPHFLFQEGWDEYSQTWPRYGMMVRGECYQLPPWARDTGATVFGELSGDGIEGEGKARMFGTSPCRNAPRSERFRRGVMNLGELVDEENARQASAWPTPTAKGNGNRTEYGGKSGDGLDTAVKRAGAESATGPTPTTIGLDGGSNSRRAARARGRYIEGAGAPSATGPTPQANDAKHGMGENREGHQIMLIHAIRDRAAAPSATGPTPKAHDRHPTTEREKPRDNLNSAVERGKTKSHVYPTIGTQTMGGCSGSFAKLKELEEIGRLTPEERRAMSSHLTGGKDLDTANCGMLNPDWVEWLMGWPIGWTDIDDGGELLWLELDDDPAEWEPPLMHRITRKKKHRVKRIETLGNGQVPLCAAVAFAFGFEIVRVAIEGRSAA
jgi:DNA (cytosine-5)-methyltransferase 1